MNKLVVFLLLMLASPAFAFSPHNDDSCDIGVAPAATLLLPFFEVDLDDPNGETTVFTITNVDARDRIARVTLWTVFAYPALTFDVALDGYGVQSINLYDVIGRGVLARSCRDVPAPLPGEVVARLQRVFLEGIADDCDFVGYELDTAIGYATIDLVRNCSANSPMTHEYWTGDLAWDNVLIGDFEQIDSANDFAQGSPLVHIRAVPEGGTLAQRLAMPSPFPRTFYARYQPAVAPGLDGRQPLPSVFAARWISDGSTMATHFKIWREGPTGREATCGTWRNNVTEIVDVVRFDEAENAFGIWIETRTVPIPVQIFLPASSLIDVEDASIYPQPDNEAVSGWMYFNLDTPGGDATSNWVVASMRAAGRYSVDMDAAALGNGCSPPAERSRASEGNGTIGPRP